MSKQSWHWEKCAYCNGYGVVSDYRGGDFNGAMECPRCNGSGRFVVYPSGAIAQYPGGPFLSGPVATVQGEKMEREGA